MYSGSCLLLGQTSRQTLPLWQRTSSCNFAQSLRSPHRSLRDVVSPHLACLSCAPFHGAASPRHVANVSFPSSRDPHCTARMNAVRRSSRQRRHKVLPQTYLKPKAARDATANLCPCLSTRLHFFFRSDRCLTTFLHLRARCSGC